MAATFTWQGSDQNGTDSASNPFDIGGSGSTVNLTQSRVWATSVASSPIPAAQSSIERYFRAKFSGSFNDINTVKIWRSDSNTLTTGVTLKLGGLPSGVAYAVPSTTTNGDASVPTSEPGSSNLNVDSSGTTRYAPPLAAGPADRYMRLQLDSTSSTPAGNVSDGSPQIVLTLKYTES